MFRKAEFNAVLARNEKSKEFVADLLGINIATLYRKINGQSDFTRSDIQLIRCAFHLTADEVDRIFFAE